MARELFKDHILRMTQERNCVLAAWYDAPTVPQLREFARAGKEIRRTYDQLALFNVVLSGKPSFSQEVREETARMTRSESIFNLATAHLVLVEGLAGAATRAFLSTMVLVGRPRTPTKVFADREGAAAWIHGFCREGKERWTREELFQFLTTET